MYNNLDLSKETKSKHKLFGRARINFINVAPNEYIRLKSHWQVEINLTYVNI